MRSRFKPWARWARRILVGVLLGAFLFVVTLVVETLVAS